MLSWLLLLLWAAVLNAIQLPYNPSAALLSSDSDAVYLLLPSQDGTNFQLSRTDLNSTVSGSDSSTSIASSLPFAPSPTTALLATIDSTDKIYLLAGDCNRGASASQLWTIEPTNNNPQWMQVQVNASGVASSQSNGGINMLSASVQFNDNMYIFGGMCPNSSQLTADNWQASGSYSHDVLSVSSTATISQVVTRGPPIAEAGLSMTPLDAAFLNNSGSTMARQQNFVLIGGHTDSAFISMSQVALFSLPEQTWAFASIDTPSDLSAIERSGHAAALSSDGKTIFVFGGWVGDISSPAEPQLLVLSIGANYGGSGDWSWSAPVTTGISPSLYGHSMIMLPGDILMISGGYSFSSEDTTLNKRDAGTTTHFYNTSSSTWISEYTKPSTSSDSDSTTSSNSPPKLALGLGLGLGLGFLLILILCLGLWFGRRKVREHRRNRNRRLLQQSMNAANGPQPFTAEQTQWMTQRSRTIGDDPYPWAPVPGDIESVRRASSGERDGPGFDVPAPARGMKRSLHSRPASHRYEDSTRSRTGQIHTIAESDENEKAQDIGDHDVIAEAPPLDPFRDPEPHLLDRRTPSPVSPALERELEMQHWYSDWGEAEQRQTSGRASSPNNKSDRTTSSLSDSNRSVVSALSYQPSVRRDNSKKSTPQVSPPESPTAAHSRQRSQSFAGSRPSEITSFARLQAEGQALLGGGAALSAGPSPRVASRPRSFLGSVRRALGGGSSHSSASATSAALPSRLPAEPMSQHSPQRSASLGTTRYIQRRQGAQDWGESPSPPKSVNNDEEIATAADEDWDVESAVERRVVQVMFTVPRGSLRVVNAGPDGDGASVVEAEAPLIQDVTDEITEDPGTAKEGQKKE